MNKIVLIGVGVVVVGVIVFLMMNTSAEKVVLKDGPIVVFGDSLVKGVGASSGNDVPSVLSNRLGVPVRNVGVSGDTSAMALARIDSDVLAQSPSIVVVIIGGNDFLRRVPKATTLTNVRSIIEKIQATGAVVVLAGIEPLVYNSDYRDIARDHNAIFIPNILSLTRGNDALMSDQIHPNDAGYVLFADAIEEKIRELLKP